MFNKSQELFPVKKHLAYLSHCSISTLYEPAREKAAEVLMAQTERGILGNKEYSYVLDSLRTHLASILRTDPDNCAFVKNTSEGMGMIANGYPFKTGDEIISYIHEYPANYYPWRLQEQRGVSLRLLPNRDMTPDGASGSMPCGWSIEDLEALLTPKTRLVVISHVQFSSGFAADIRQLGDLCRKYKIDLVLDAAQSLGCLPIEPEEWNISAVVASGWKWLLGPVGTGVMFTTPAFRQKLDHVLTGAELMRQESDYLNHTWDPQTSAKRFEYSTSHVALAAALETCLGEIHAQYGVEALKSETFRLQNTLLSGLDQDKYTPLVFADDHRSGILSLICNQQDPETVQDTLKEQGVIASARSGYLRLAPFYSNTQEEMEKAVSALNA
ncbi:MAG: aminotransferase class V-fold PLP-dependent enzyme [Desulfovermiculus sp.]|nr:aminotransferase class V-fold PLP-dependent enzyme [Desulfovermiculus sp.]